MNVTTPLNGGLGTVKWNELLNLVALNRALPPNDLVK